MNRFNDNALINSSRRKIKGETSKKDPWIICAIFNTLAVTGLFILAQRIV